MMDEKDQIELIAAACHMANRAYAIGIGDTSHEEWKDAPEWQRQSARDGVKAALENPDITPRETHESWMSMKEADGWSYGKVKDAVAKTHPCMRRYDRLPVEQRVKDEIFLSTIKTLRMIMAERMEKPNDGSDDQQR